MLIDDVLDSVDTAAAETLVRPFDLKSDVQNQLLFFLKPECFISKSPEARRALLAMIFDSLGDYKIGVDGVLTMSGPRLSDLQIMDKHYGFINAMSRSASISLDPESRVALAGLVGCATTVPVLGGHEFLEKFPDYDAVTLEDLWKTKPSKRLRGGLYAEVFAVDGDDYVIVNGFHPEQLAHFTGDDRTIVIMLLHSELPWRFLRSQVLGDTYPNRAVPGSIRRRVYERAVSFGFESVGIGNNCAHMSAGPVEGLFELSNFLGNSASVDFDLPSSRMARWLVSMGFQLPVDSVLVNPSVGREAGMVSVNDLTEDLDAQSAAGLLALYSAQIRS